MTLALLGGVDAEGRRRVERRVLEYAYLLDVQPVLALENKPSAAHWDDVLTKHGIILVWNGASDRLMSRSDLTNHFEIGPD